VNGMLRFAWRNLRTRPVRSALALLGLMVAIMGMVGLFSVAEGLNATFKRTFDRIPGLIVIQPGAPIPLFSRLPAAWAEEMRALPGVRTVCPEVWGRAHIIDGKPAISPPRLLLGTTLAESTKLGKLVYRDTVFTGRFLTTGDIGQPRCVISRQIGEEYKKGVGDTLKIDGQDMEIVGLYHTGSLLLDVGIIVDVSVVREMQRVSKDTVCSYYVEPENPKENAVIIKRIHGLFAGRSPGSWDPASSSSLAIMTGTQESQFVRLLTSLVEGFRKAFSGPPVPPKPTTVAKTSPVASGGGDMTTTSKPAESGSSMPFAPQGGGTSPDLPVDVRTADAYANELRKLSADLDLFLLIMTSIGLVIAVLGIVNTMLMSVTERFIDFGILKANGWADRDVLLLITFESGLLGLGGGLLGALAGWIGTELINARWSDRIHLYASPQLLLFSILFSLLVGVLGGLYPAFWASRLMPMDAIRRG
jgi:putative ABC transport system permease protein